MSGSSNRVRALNDAPVGAGPVVYWMQRDQRAEYNWALHYAQEQALARGVQLVVVFNLVADYGGASWRQYDFLLRGLAETAKTLAKKQIPFVLLEGQPQSSIGDFIRQQAVGELVCDFHPLRQPRQWRTDIAKKSAVRVTEVDAHNIIPCWVASDKQEFAAHTFRLKVHRQLKTYLTDFPTVKIQSVVGPITASAIDWTASKQSLQADRSVAPVKWLIPGPQAAKKQTQNFITNSLDQYSEHRNDPNQAVLSNLSPYLHFGQLSAQWLASQVQQARDTSADSRAAYLEELIVRRELTDNFCYYNAQYDSVAGAHPWAQKTIAEHAQDEREYIYGRKELEEGKTHDELWNAMQLQMVQEGKMHGWCRMYWAKKILEWSEHAQLAIDRALYLNDTYELDGNDPNGVVGVMWSICGVHDRAWGQRPVFGKIRYMNFNGAKRKFDVAAYIKTHTVKQTLFND